MAEDDDLNMGDEGVAPAPAKKSGIGAAFNGLLKWIIIALAAIIVIFVVVCLLHHERSLLSQHCP